MQHLRILVLLFLLLIPLSACSKSPEEKARNALRQTNIEYSENSFIKYVEKGDKAVTDLFLTAGMSPNLRKSDSTEEPILNIAAAYNHAEIVTLLLAKGADVNAKDKDGNTALMVVARAVVRKDNNIVVERILLEKGADVNLKDNEGYTALIKAARVNNIELLKALLNKGADVNARNNAGYTALILAQKYAYTKIVDILEKAGATIPKEAIEEFLTVADSQWQKGDYQNALQNYQEILLFDPNNSKAKEFLKKYSAVQLTHEKAESIFKKRSGYDEFERKEQAKERKEFLARKEAYYELTDDFAISEYDFKKQRFIVTVGSKTGKKVGEAIPVSYALLIVNKNGGAIELFLNMNESNATSFRGIEKKLFIIYKLIKVEEYTYFDPLVAQVAREMRNNRFAGAAYINSVRRYIKPLYVALLTGNEKYVLYEAKESEIKSKSTTKIKPIEKRMKRK